MPLGTYTVSILGKKKKKFRLSYSADLSTSFKMYLFPVKFEKNPFEITPAQIV